MSLPVSLVCEAGFCCQRFWQRGVEMPIMQEGPIRTARAHEQVNTGARDLTFTSGFIRTTIGDEGLMATEIKCTCGAIWERTEVQTEARDSDDFQCTCGRTLETWNRSRVPQFRLLKAADEKR
jgi:hypothetical protein